MRANFAVAAAAVLSIAALAGCGPEPDPATEAPVELKPGLYKAALYDAGPFGTMSNSRKRARFDQICVTEGDIDDFPRKLVEGYLLPDPICDFEENPRVGNAFSGKITCSADQEKVSGGFVTDYSGLIAVDKVTVDAKRSYNMTAKDPRQGAQLEQGKALMNMVALQVGAERVGDCP